MRLVRILKMTVDNPVLYRYVDISGEADIRMVMLFKYPILKTTNKGVWIYCDDGKQRFVLNEDKDGYGKRYAYATKDFAKRSWIVRKQRQKQKLEQQLRDVNELLQLCWQDLPDQPYIAVTSLSEQGQKERKNEYYRSIK